MSGSPQSVSGVTAGCAWNRKVEAFDGTREVVCLRWIFKPRKREQLYPKIVIDSLSILRGTKGPE